MRRMLLKCICMVSLVGCANFASPIPEGYQGPLATIKDSAHRYGSIKADLFYVTEVDGRHIEDSRSKTREVNSGRGAVMDPVILQRQVPAGARVLRIAGGTEYAAPVMAFTNPVFQVAGDVKVELGSGKTYVVTGELGEGYSGVWVVDESSNEIIGSKVEIRESASSGSVQE